MVPDPPPSRDDAAEFERLLAPHLDRAYGVARRLTRNESDAEDLVQDAALLAYRGFPTFERGSNFRAWFLRVLMNAFLSSKRRRRPEDDAVSFDEVPNAYIQRQVLQGHRGTGAQGHAGTEARAAGDVAREVIGKLESEQVAAAVDSLPDEFRAAAALYFLQDLSYQEIASLLKVPVGTVRSRLHRGRALLQRRLWQVARDHGLVPGETP